jgi:hypothetical protein
MSGYLTPLAALVLGTLVACADDSVPTTEPESTTPGAAVGALALASNTWTERAPLPNNASGAVLGMAYDAAGRSIVYALGGRVDAFVGFNVQAYSVASNTWTRKAARVFVESANGVGKIGSRLYFSGGYDWSSGSRAASNRLWAYDYTNDRMIRKADLPKFTADGVSGVIDGKLYVLPGICSGDGWPNSGYCETEPYRQLHRYDPATNTWTTRRAAPHFHPNGGAAVIGGKFYVVGGILPSSQRLADLDVYDPATNTWRTLAPIPTAGPVAATALQGKLFAVSQLSGAQKVYSYNPATNTWKSLATPPGPVADVTRVTLDGKSAVFSALGTGDPFSGPIPSMLYTP